MKRKGKHLWPYAYLILNEKEVFETGFTLGTGRQGEVSGLSAAYKEQNYSKCIAGDSALGGIRRFDGRSILPLTSVDRIKLERVKESASLYFAYEGEAGNP